MEVWVAELEVESVEAWEAAWAEKQVENVNKIKRSEPRDHVKSKQDTSFKK